MSANANLDVLNRAVALFNAGKVDEYIKLLYTPDAVAHFLPPSLPQGHAGLQPYYGGFHAAFPDAQILFDDVICATDRIVVRFHLNMTHTGEFNGIPATGRPVMLEGITILRFGDGKVVERWSESNFVSLMEQLGVGPIPSGD